MAKVDAAGGSQDPAPSGEIIEFEITALTHSPAAIGRHAGRATFTPLAAPGERVRAEIVEERKSYARARLVEVLSPAPERVAPPCPHFGACGGCHWQHLDYAAQLRWKQAVTAGQLERIGGFRDPPVRETLPAPAPLGYRNQARFSLTPDGRPGFHALQSAEVVPIAHCHILDPRLADLYQSLDLAPAPGLLGLTLRAGADDDLMLVLEMDEGAESPAVELDLPVSVVALWPDGGALTLAGSDALQERVLGRVFQVSAGSFFQVNTAAAETLVSLALQRLALRGGERVLDLYCGVGLFAAFSAPRAGQVTGVESYAPAVRDAEVNLDEFDNVELYEAPVEDVLPHLRGPFAAALLDPPRAGCAPRALAALAALGPERIVYVSCDLSSLARDGRRLAEAGYRLAEVQPLDMFPQTFHVETVSVFERAQLPITNYR